MKRTLRLWLLCAIACAASACSAPPKLPEVGVVLVAPQVRPAPVPTIVQQVEPKPVGYFQQRLLERRMRKMTPSTPTS